MVLAPVRRQSRWHDVPTFAYGLVSDVDYLNADPRAVQLAQNARCRTGRLKKRNGTRYYSPIIGSGITARCVGLHQWVPATTTDENFVYAASGSHIYRLPWDSTSVAPPTSLVDMTFPTSQSWQADPVAVHFQEYNDFCFAFNGKDYGMAMRRDSPNTMYTFGIAKMPAPTVTTSATGGSIAAGVYKYKVRAVREVSSRVREYWGAMSDATSITTTGATSSNRVTWAPTTDDQVTHYYVYRTLLGLETFYYLATVAVGTEVYTDTSAAPSDEIDEDVLDRIKGIRYSAVDASVMFVVGDSDSACNWYSSNPNRPQEFGTYANDTISEGSGEVTGCVSFNGNVFVFREKGIAVFTQDSARNYYPSGFISGYGCIAPWSVRVIRDGSNNFVTFFDDSEGPCLLTVNGIRSIKRTKHSDVAKWVDTAIDKNKRKFVTVGYHDSYIYWGYAPEGQTYNTACLVFDSTTESWFGPDTGYSLGPSCTRINGRGVYGSGEMLAAIDGDSVYVMEVDAPYSRDADTSKIVLSVKGMAIASAAFPNETEFMSIAVMARLSSIFRMDVSVTSNDDYSASCYIAPKQQRYYWDDGTLIDRGATFDAAVQALMDASVFDGGDVFDTMRDLPYEIELDSCSCQGAYLLVDLYDENSYALEICGMKILAVDRGAR